MVRTGRSGFSDFEQAEIWRGWKSGRTLRSIGRSLGCSDMHVRNLVSASGGFAPPPRRHSSRVLSRSEREEISRAIAAGDSMRTIAAALERSPSTVSQEIARHGGPEAYRDDLPEPVHPSPRCTQEGTPRALEDPEDPTAFQARHVAQEITWSDRRCDLDQRTPGRNRGSCRPWPLGGGFDRGHKPIRHRDARRATLSIRDAGQGC